MVGSQFVGRGALAGGIAVLGLVVGGLGVATAANGGSLTLGHRNHATQTTTLKDSKGTPLSLVGKKSRAPLKVNSSKQVTHLNASLVGGMSAAQLATNGSSAQTAVDVGVPIADTSETVVAQTATLKAGKYFIQAAALLDAVSGGFCYVGTSTASGTAVQWGGGEGDTTETWVQASESVEVTVTTAEPIGEYCESNAATGSVYDAGITAIQIAHGAPGTAAAITTKARRSRVEAPGH